MKKIIPFFIILIIISSCKKEVFDIRKTIEFSIQSGSNGATYPVKIALPDNYDTSVNKYATLYLLDGEENFNFVAGKCQKLCKDYSSTNLIVVSIGYGNDRSLDYTPTRVNEKGGGADKFMSFIKNELIPKMENEYGADTTRESRVILGHSFGGLFATYAFTNYNCVFGNYLILSPSLWYDNEILFRMEQDNRNTNKNSSQLVFMGLGVLEGSGRMQAPFEAFYQRLNGNYPDMKIARHLVPGLDHMGSKNSNICEGLRFYFQNK